MGLAAVLRPAVEAAGIVLACLLNGAARVAMRATHTPYSNQVQVSSVFSMLSSLLGQARCMMEVSEG